MSKEIFDCLKRERDIYVQTINTAFMLTSALSDRDQFSGQKFDIFFCFLFRVSDYPTWSRLIVRKSSHRSDKTLVFNNAKRTDDGW